jgi:hypothetical protein
MRFIVMHKVDAQMEAGGRPDQETISTGSRLSSAAKGKRTWVDGSPNRRS